MAWIYLVEDDRDIAQRVSAMLESRGHKTQWFATPHEFFYQLSKRSPSLVLVDCVLPEMSGVDVIVRIRQLLGRSVGVMMLTALDSEENVVLALENGADDYLVKPSTEAVLRARVDALLRRLSSSPIQAIEAGPYRLDFARQVATVAGQSADLTPREFDLAWTLFSQRSRLITKQELQAAIWGKGSDLGHHTIAQHVYSVRKKLDLAKHGGRLVAVYAAGYRLELPDEWESTDTEYPSANQVRQINEPL